MVRNYKRKTNRGAGVGWNQVDMDKAVEAIKNKTMSIRQAAKKYNVPKSTLVLKAHGWKGRPSTEHSKSGGRPKKIDGTLLLKIEENENSRCLLCLLDIEDKNKTGINVVNLCELIQHRSLEKSSIYQNIIQNVDIVNVNFCPDCILIVDEATEVHDQIVQLEGKLRTQMNLIRNKIRDSNNQDNFNSDDDKLDKLRRSLLRLSSDDENGKVHKTDEVEEVTVKLEPITMEEDVNEERDEFDNDFDESMMDPFEDDEGPCSLSEFLIVPDNHKTSFKEEYKQEEINYVENDAASSLPISNKTKPSFDNLKSKPKYKTPPSYCCALCEGLRIKFKRKTTYDAHMYIVHEDKDNQPLCCSKCDKKFTLDYNLQRHLKLHEVEDKKPIVCPICDCRLEDQSRLEAHVVIHDTHVNCQVCGKRMRKTSLKGHMNLHTAEKSFKCNHCDQHFLSWTHKSNHMLKHHSTPGSYPCTNCEKHFLHQHQLTRHIKKVHEKALVKTCDECGEKFTKLESLRAHQIEKHDAQPWICDECGNKFKSLQGLRSHKFTHTGEKPFQCEICDQRFATTSNLSSHKICHTDNREHICDQCGKAFKSKPHLQRHVKHIHSKDTVERLPRSKRDEFLPHSSAPVSTKRVKYTRIKNNKSRKVSEYDTSSSDFDRDGEEYTPNSVDSTENGRNLTTSSTNNNITFPSSSFYNPVLSQYFQF